MERDKMYPQFFILGSSLSSYGICMATAVILVGSICIIRAKRCDLSLEDVLIVGAMGLAAALPAGEILYILVTYPVKQLIAAFAAGDFSVFTAGGIVFYGGLLGGVAGALLGCRIAGCKVSDVERTAVPLLPMGHAIGRIGCLLAGCCYGFAYDGPLCVYYPSSPVGLPAEQGYFPVQLLEAAINVVLCVFLLRKAEKKRDSFELLMWYLSEYAAVRFVLEFMRGDPARGIWFGLSLSQWISIGIMVVSVLYWAVRKNNVVEKGRTERKLY